MDAAADHRPEETSKTSTPDTANDPTPPPATRIRPSRSTTAAAVPLILANDGPFSHRPTGEDGEAVGAVERPLRAQVRATTTTMTSVNPANRSGTALASGRRPRTAAPAGRAQFSHRSPTSVRTRQRGQIGCPHSAQLSRVDSPWREHSSVLVVMARARSRLAGVPLAIGAEGPCQSTYRRGYRRAGRPPGVGMDEYRTVAREKLN